MSHPHVPRLALPLAAVAFSHIAAPAAFADQVFTESVIVDDHLLCVGGQCADGEAGYPDRSVLKIKANRTALWFEDTSGAGFSSTDWLLMANQVGLNAFQLWDLDVGTAPFGVLGGAPGGALWIDGTGFIGLGTSLPEQPLHILPFGGVTPRIKLETLGVPNNGWEITGLPSAFRIQDESSGKTVLNIEADSPPIAVSDGNFGFGTPNPTAPLELFGNDTFNFFRITATGAQTNESVDIVFTQGPLTTGELRYKIVDGDGPEMKLDANGNLELEGVLTTQGPSCSAGCDRVFAPDYPLPSIQDHAAAMLELGHLPAVGPTKPLAPVNVSEKLGGVINELEHAHLYIAELQDRLAGQERRFTALLAAQQAQIDRLLAERGAR